MWPEMTVVCDQAWFLYLARNDYCMWPEITFVCGQKVLLYVARNDSCMWPDMTLVCDQRIINLWPLWLILGGDAHAVLDNNSLF